MIIYIVSYGNVIEGAFSTHEKAIEAAKKYKKNGHYFTAVGGYGIAPRQVDCMYDYEETEKPY